MEWSGAEWNWIEQGRQCRCWLVVRMTHEVVSDRDASLPRHTRWLLVATELVLLVWFIVVELMLPAPTRRLPTLC